MNTPLISVIVPVYNVEKYIRRCLESIVKQSYQNLEIIVVDDGSTDNSGNICDDIASEDSRITVIHQKNLGLAGARNTGLDIYKGEYVCFIDSDDYIHPEYVSYLYKLCIDNDCKMAICDSISASDDSTYGKFDSKSEPTIYTGKELLDMFYGDMHGVIVVAWDKLIHRSCIGSSRFPQGLIHEDESSTFRFIYNAEKIAYTPNQLYSYFTRADSITAVAFSMKNLDILKAYEYRLDFFKEQKETDLYNREYSYYLSAILINYHKVHETIQDNADILKDLKNTYRIVYKKADKSILPLSRRIIYFICRFSPLLYGRIRSLS